MKIFYTIILIALVLLALASGLVKVMLVQVEVDFYGPYGFSNPILIAFGILQLLGAILMALPKTRRLGAVLVAITFLVSAVVLMVAGNVMMAAVTLVFVMLLGVIVKQTRDTVVD